MTIGASAAITDAVHQAKHLRNIPYVLVVVGKKIKKKRLYHCALTRPFTFHTTSNPARHKRTTHRMNQFSRSYDVEGVISFFFFTL